MILTSLSWLALFLLVGKCNKNVCSSPAAIPCNLANTSVGYELSSKSST